MRKYKIVMLLGNDFLHPYPDPRVYKEAKSLVNAGFDVHVVCWVKRNMKGIDFEETENIKIHRLFNKLPSTDKIIFLKLPYYGKYIINCVNYIFKLKPDFIHCHDLDTLAVGVIAKMKTRKPLIFDAHEDFPVMLKHDSGPLIGIVARIYENFLIKFADKVIAAEIPYVEIMKKHYNLTPYVVGNYPDLQVFKKDMDIDVNKFLDKYKLFGDVILYVGGIEKGRGVAETIEAFPFVNKDVVFFAVGKATPEYQKILKERINQLNIQGKVKFEFNGIPYVNLPIAYAISKVSVVILDERPNAVVSLPTKMFESMAMGVPVLGGIYPYIKDFVRNNKIGLPVDSMNPSEIAEKIDIMLDNKEMRANMGSNGLRLIREKFNWSKSEEVLLQVYEELHSKKR